MAFYIRIYSTTLVKRSSRIFIHYCVSLADIYTETATSGGPFAKDLGALPPFLLAHGDIQVIGEVNPSGFYNSQHKLGHIASYSSIVDSDRAFSWTRGAAIVDIEPIMIEGQTWNRSVLGPRLLARLYLPSRCRLDIHDTAGLTALCFSSSRTTRPCRGRGLLTRTVPWLSSPANMLRKNTAFKLVGL